MEDLISAVRALHVVAATLWVGGAFFMAFILGPSIVKAGPAAGPFLATVMRRGGLSPFFLSAGSVAVLAGGYVYGELLQGHGGGPFASTYTTLLTLGVLAGVLALLLGFTVLLPNELRIKALVREMPEKGPPAREQAARMQALGAKQGKMSAVGALLLTLGLLFMVLSKVV
jgi:uncharacterized membrane protein